MTTVPIAETIRQFVDFASGELRVCLPCYVTKINHDDSGNFDGTVNAQISIKRPETENQNAVDLPIVTGCNVEFLASWLGGDSYAIIKVPIEVGTLGSLVFTDFDISEWTGSQGDKPIDPLDPTFHDLSSAKFVPGLTTRSRPYGSFKNNSDLEMIMVKGNDIDSRIAIRGDSGNIDVESNKTVSVSASRNVEIDAGENFTASGKKVEITSDTESKLDSTTSVKLGSGNEPVLKGNQMVIDLETHFQTSVDSFGKKTFLAPFITTAKSTKVSTE